MRKGNSKKNDTIESRDPLLMKSNSGLGVQDEFKRKYQLSTNEIDELRSSLYYVESKLEKEMDVKEELIEKAEQDHKNLVDCRRKLREQEEVNRSQAQQIDALKDQLNKFTDSQDNIVKHLKEKFHDYNKEMDDKEEKVQKLTRALLDTQSELEAMTKEKDRYLKELEFADETSKTKDAQIKRLHTELNLAEKTIEEFITCKEKQISSFFDDDTIYTDARKIESILTSLDETKKDYSRIGKVDESNLPNCRPYLLQKIKQEELKRKEMEAEEQREPDLTTLPEEIMKIVQKYRSKNGNELSPKAVDRMLVEINKAYHYIKQDKITKIKSQMNAEIQYLKRLLALLIPLDKDKAKTEIAYLRTELKRAREDIRRLNIIIKRKGKGANDKSIDFGQGTKYHGLSDDNLNDISTEDGYKSNSRFIEKALSVAENAVNETKGLNSRINDNMKDFKGVKTKNYSTWREEDNKDDMLSEDWLISEINSALKSSNQNIERMMYASRLNLAKSGVELLK